MDEKWVDLGLKIFQSGTFFELNHIVWSVTSDHAHANKIFWHGVLQAVHGVSRIQSSWIWNLIGQDLIMCDLDTPDMLILNFWASYP